MAALHEARSLINEGATASEHGNPWVAQLVAGYHTNPAQIAELYDVAGMIGPGEPSVPMVTDTPSAYRHPHDEAIPHRLLVALRDGPQTAQELSRNLGAKIGTVQVSIGRLRARGAQIEGVSLGGRLGCRYRLMDV